MGYFWLVCLVSFLATSNHIFPNQRFTARWREGRRQVDPPRQSLTGFGVPDLVAFRVRGNSERIPPPQPDPPRPPPCRRSVAAVSPQCRRRAGAPAHFWVQIGPKSVSKKCQKNGPGKKCPKEPQWSNLGPKWCQNCMEAEK